MKTLFDLPGLALLGTGWITGLGWFVIVIAVRATHVHTIEPLLPFLLAPVWLLCLCLVAADTYNILEFVTNRILRLLVASLAVLVQCFLYCMLLLPLSICVHLWSGGHL